MKKGRKITVISQILLILTFGFIVFDSLFFSKDFAKISRLKRELKNIHTKIELIKQENGQLRSTIERLKSDPLAVETIAREELNMARPGETVYQLPMYGP